MGSEPTYFLWTIATAFGPVECGAADDRWRQLWENPMHAAVWARMKNDKSPFGDTVFPIPLPEYAERSWHGG